MGRSRVTAVIFLLCVLLSSIRAQAQEVRASIGGRVVDSQGGLIPGAEVTIVSVDTGLAQRTLTNEQGSWLLQFLLPGQYELSVVFLGFKKFERRGITLQAADHKTLDVELQVGDAEQVVDVTAEIPLIDTSSAGSGTVITSREIAEMPSGNRVSTLLATLAPGVVAQDQNNNVVRMWSYYGASQFSATGGSGIMSNNYQLDGLPNTKSGGYVAYIPSTDILQEFRVQTNTYDAQIGRQAGATINMETKAGTKDYHGVLYEYNQNNFLNARQYGFTSTNRVRLNQYGGQFGGPVWIPGLYGGAKKTFFFFAFEGLRNSNPQITLRSVPTELERKGDFSQSYTVVSGVRYPINVYDPLRVDANGNRQQFSGNVIPTDRLNSIAQNILKYVPVPNLPGDPAQGNAVNNFQSSTFRGDKMASVNVRVDHQWNDLHRTFGVYRWNSNDDIQGNDFNNPATGVYQTRTPRALGLDHVWTLSSNKVLDLRAAVNRFVEWTRDGGSYAGFNQASLGLPERLVSQLHPAFPAITGFAGGFGTNNSTYTINTYYTFSAGLTQTRGDHALKYGGEYWILQQTNGNWGLQPQFTFGPEWTRPVASAGGGIGQGSTFGSFLLGLPNGGTINNNATGVYSQRFLGVFLQDDWRVSTRLTLNLGLRWDYERPVTERFERMVSNYDPTAVSPINAQAQANYAAIIGNPAAEPLKTLAALVPASSFQVLGAQLFVGTNGQPRTAHNADYHEFQPRFGFAYQLTPTTVLRGGAGRFTQASWENAGQSGFSQNTLFSATNDNYLTANETLSNPYLSGVQPAKGSSLGAMSNLGSNPYWINQNPDRPYTWNYSLALQKEYKSWLFELGYSHTKTSGLRVTQITNLTSFDLWKQLRSPAFDATGRPVQTLLWDQLVPNPFLGIAGLNCNNYSGTNYCMNTATNIPLNYLLRPVKLLTDGLTRGDNPIGFAQYDAMLFKVQRRFSRGFSILNSFTWSKSFENTAFWGPQISGYVLDHRLGGEDRPFHLSIAPTWDLPVGRGRQFGGGMTKLLDVVAGGWELSGSLNLQSGTPVTFSNDSFYNGKSFGLSGGAQSLSKWFDTSAFLPFPSRNTCLQGNPYCDPSLVVNYPEWTGIQNMPGFTYYGTPSDYRLVNGKMTCSGVCNGVYQDFATFVRRYPTRFSGVRNPGVNEVNLGLFKNFQVTERIKVQYRFEAFNAFNRARFGGPNTDPGSSGFGTIARNQVNQARQVQMALKLYF